jgi:hypothetical protein
MLEYAVQNRVAKFVRSLDRWYGLARAVQVGYLALDFGAE